MTRQLITIASAAERLALAEQTVRRYVDQGRLTGYRVGPRQLRLDAHEVDNLARPIVTIATFGNLPTPEVAPAKTATRKFSSTGKVAPAED